MPTNGEKNQKATTETKSVAPNITKTPDTYNTYINYIKEMLEEQREILYTIYKETRKTSRYILVGRIISFIYLIIVITPLVLAAIYLPPIIKDAIEPYKELLNATTDVKSNMSGGSVTDILKQLGK